MRQHLSKKVFRSIVGTWENERWTSRSMDGFLRSYLAERQRMLRLTMSRTMVKTTSACLSLSNSCLY
jgi:hypothetical protein